MDERPSPRSTGAFRTRGSYRPSVEYEQCDECQRIYEVENKTHGLAGYQGGLAGSVSLPADYYEKERLRQEKSDRLKALFAIPSSRCVCDPDGDIVFLQARELEKRESDARLAAMRANDAKRKKTETSAPKPNGLGTTGAALRSPSATPRSGKGDEQILDQLKQLSDLFNAGALTKEQFEAAKNKLLGL